MAIIRLDKLLSSMGYGSRKEIKSFAKKGLVTVDGIIEKKTDVRIDTEKNVVCFDGEVVKYVKYTYLMMNKPAGIISATDDPNNEEQTVIDLLDDDHFFLHPFPVGRLDKDTVGLLILTNDGIFAHRTLSPKKHVEKVYYAKVTGRLTESDITTFANGVTLEDGYLCKPAVLKIISSDDISEAEIVLTEGKYHQVKRMFASQGKTVVYLKRTAFDKITLDENLAEGEYRELTPEEMLIIDRFIDKDE